MSAFGQTFTLKPRTQLWSIKRVSSRALGKVLLLHSSKETGAPPDASSTLDNEGSFRDPEQLTSAGLQWRQVGHSGLVCLILGVPPPQLTGGRHTALAGSQGKCAPAPPVRRAHGPVGIRTVCTHSSSVRRVPGSRGSILDTLGSQHPGHGR